MTEVDTPNWSDLFCRYKDVSYFPVPFDRSLLILPACSSQVIRDEPDGQDVYFEEAEVVSYFFDFSPKNLERLLREGEDALSLFTPNCQIEEDVIHTSGGVLLYRSRNVSESIQEVLERLRQEGKSVTHFVRADETYSGSEAGSTSRDYVSAKIYELGDT